MRSFLLCVCLPAFCIRSVSDSTFHYSPSVVVQPLISPRPEAYVSHPCIASLGLILVSSILCEICLPTIHWMREKKNHRGSDVHFDERARDK